MCRTLDSASFATRGGGKGTRVHAAAVCIRVLRLASNASPSAPPRAPPSAAVSRVCHSLTIMLLYRIHGRPWIE